MSGTAIQSVEGVEELNLDEGEPDRSPPKRVLAARSAKVRAVAAETGRWSPADPFGPFDLCYVIKAWRGPGWTNRVFRRGYYHHLSGSDVSMEGACSYFTNLATAVEPGRWLSSITGEWAIEEATFCFYAAFSQVDIRVTVRIPAVSSSASAAVNQFVVDKAGMTMGCTAALWREVRLSAALRALGLSRLADAAADNQLAADILAIPRTLLFVTPQAGATPENSETELLLLASEFYGMADRPAVSSQYSQNRRWSVEGSGGCNIIGDAMFAFFAESGRYKDGLAFFTGLARGGHLSAWLAMSSFSSRMGEPAAAADALQHVEDALSKLEPVTQRSVERQDDIEAAGGTVFVEVQPPQDAPMAPIQVLPENDASTSCVRETPRSWATAIRPAVLRMKASACGSIGEVHDGVRTSCQAIAADPGIVESWLLLVRLLFAGEAYGLALLVLNCMPAAEFDDEVSYGHVADAYTEPAEHSCGSCEAVDRQTLVEEMATPGNKDLTSLPAAKLRGASHHAYELLVLFANTLGWEELLDLRAALFLVDDGDPHMDSLSHDDAGPVDADDVYDDHRDEDDYDDYDDDDGSLSGSASETESSDTDHSTSASSSGSESCSATAVGKVQEQCQSGNESSVAINMEGGLLKSKSGLPSGTSLQSDAPAESVELEQEQPEPQPEAEAARGLQVRIFGHQDESERDIIFAQHDASKRELIFALLGLPLLPMPDLNTSPGDVEDGSAPGSGGCEGTGGVGELGQHYISETLDELFQALYHDIAATARWLDFPDDDGTLKNAKSSAGTLSSHETICVGLAKLKMTELRQAAIAARLSEEELDGVYDTPDPKAAFVELLAEASAIDSEAGQHPAWLATLLSPDSVGGSAVSNLATVPIILSPLPSVHPASLQ